MGHMGRPNATRVVGDDHTRLWEKRRQAAHLGVSENETNRKDVLRCDTWVEVPGKN